MLIQNPIIFMFYIHNTVDLKYLIKRRNIRGEVDFNLNSTKCVIVVTHSQEVAKKSDRAFYLIKMKLVVNGIKNS